MDFLIYINKVYHIASKSLPLKPIAWRASRRAAPDEAVAAAGKLLATVPSQPIGANYPDECNVHHAGAAEVGPPGAGGGERVGEGSGKGGGGERRMRRKWSRRRRRRRRRRRTRRTRTRTRRRRTMMTRARRSTRTTKS